MQQNSGIKLSVCILLVQDPESPPGCRYKRPDQDAGEHGVHETAPTFHPVCGGRKKCEVFAHGGFLRLAILGGVWGWVGGLSRMLFIVPAVSF